MGFSSSNVAIAQAAVRPIPPSIPKLQLRETRLGNIFVGVQTPTFNLLTRGNSVTYQVMNYWHQQVALGAVPVSVNQGHFSIQGLRYGFFTLLPTPSTGIASQRSPFSAQTHYAQGDSPADIP